MTRGPLGCPTSGYTVTLGYRGGENVIDSFDLTGTALEWGRDLDQISQARLTVVKKAEAGQAAASAACCRLASRAEPYQHELTIYRDNDLVWTGPVTGEPTETRTGITITARDVLEWPAVRWIRRRYQGSYNVRTYLQQVITEALEVDDPNILDHIVWPVASWNIDRDIPIRSITAWDAIKDTLDTGINITTIGRRIVLSNAALDAAVEPDVILTDVDFTTSLEVKRDGNRAATAVVAIGEGNRQATVTGDTALYGRVERIIRNEQYTRTDSLTRWARSVQATNYPARTVLVVPSSATLAKQAPVGIGDLVCGRNFTVSLDPAVWCRPIDTRFRLVGVRATWAGGVEGIGITVDTPWTDGNL